MAIYIDAKLAEKNIDNVDISWCTDIDNIIEACIEALQRTPQADVVPVVHAHWLKINNPNYSPFDQSSEYYLFCSNCECGHVQMYNFCPSCGAKMDEEDGKQ